MCAQQLYRFTHRGHFRAWAWFNFNIMFEECYHQLMDFKLLGGQTYVDCSGIGMGRDLDVYIKLADSIRQLHIVASTGFDADNGIAPYFRTKDMDYFEELFIHEITKGMGHTSVKAGIISVGNGGTGSFTKLGEMVYRAAARAAKRTGAAVIAHGACSPLKQLEILTNEKLDPSRIIISHLDGSGHIDLEHDKQIARAGAYVAYDDIGIEDWSSMPYGMPDEHRVELVLAMLEAGFQDRILLSTGSKCQVLGWGEPHLHNSAHMIRYFLPKLRQAGVGEEAINGILVRNPKRVLPIQ